MKRINGFEGKIQNLLVVAESHFGFFKSFYGESKQKKKISMLYTNYTEISHI